MEKLFIIDLDKSSDNYEAAVRDNSPVATVASANVQESGGGAVESVFGRQGAVVAVSGDYDADEIDDVGTTNKFATQAELDQIGTNSTNISTNAGDITNLQTGKEDDLGNPSSDGDVLSSTIAGVRSWITPSGGGGADDYMGGLWYSNSVAAGAVNTSSIYINPTQFTVPNSSGNVCIGEQAGASYGSGASDNICIGKQAGILATGNVGCVYLGEAAGRGTTTVRDVIGIGPNAGRDSGANSCIYIGEFAGYQNVTANLAVISAGNAGHVPWLSGDMGDANGNLLLKGKLVIPTAVSALVGANPPIDWAIASSFTRYPLSVNTSFAFTNLVPGKTIKFSLEPDAGFLTVTFPNVNNWEVGGPPGSLNTDNTYVFTFYHDGTYTYGSYITYE